MRGGSGGQVNTPMQCGWVGGWVRVLGVIVATAVSFPARYIFTTSHDRAVT